MAARKKPPASGKKGSVARNRALPDSSGPQPGFDRRAMEGVMRRLVAELTGEPEDNTSLAKAQQILEQAYEADEEEQVRLARKALAVCEDCADAHILLAENAATLPDARRHLEQAVRAAERSLGADVFQEYAGHFWGYFPTRPYMRARAALAQCLWDAGEHDEALGHYRELLRLNPNDNQGLRYVLASCLLEQEQHDELDRLLAAYKDDGTAAWAYTTALSAFRRNGDTPQPGRLLKKAHRANKHVPAFLLGDRQLPRMAPEYIGLGDESEAAAYAADNLPAWKATPGAISWLRKTLKIALPRPSRGKPSWPDVSRRLGLLPQAESEVWQVEARRYSATVETPDETMYPWLLVIASNSDDDHLVCLEIEDRQPGQNAVLDALVEAMLRPKHGDPRRPGRVEVRQKGFQNAWRSKLRQIQVECLLCKELEQVEAVLEIASPPPWLARQLSGEPGVPLEVSDTDPADLPQAVEEVWQADIRRLPIWIENQGDPQRPWGALVVSCSEAPVLAQDIRTEAPDAQWLWQQVIQAMARPFAGEPRRPGRLELRENTWAEAMRPKLEALNVGCEVCEELLPLETIFEDLGQHVAGDAMTALVDVPGVTPELVGAFFAAAAGFYRQAPWQYIDGDAPIRIECDRFQSGPWHAVVMGQSGITLGLALYEDLEVLCEILSGGGEDEENARRTNGMSVTYGPAFEVAPQDLDAAEQYGWEVAGPEAHPHVMRVNPGHAVRPPLAWELELLTACLTALPRFLKQGTPSATVGVPLASGPLSLRLTRIGDEQP